MTIIITVIIVILILIPRTLQQHDKFLSRHNDESRYTRAYVPCVYIIYVNINAFILIILYVYSFFCFNILIMSISRSDTYLRYNNIHSIIIITFILSNIHIYICNIYTCYIYIYIYYTYIICIYIVKDANYINKNREGGKRREKSTHVRDYSE